MQIYNNIYIYLYKHINIYKPYILVFTITIYKQKQQQTQRAMCSNYAIISYKKTTTSSLSIRSYISTHNFQLSSTPQNLKYIYYILYLNYHHLNAVQCKTHLISVPLISIIFDCVPNTRCICICSS